ncbi:MAG: FeoB-associated Cys-rich membrane protein [Acutalibacteraceae bacterium]|nr:FeoB-associated Cys-rich membrane protein [Acutalibacteraceae bacterium]
MENYIVALILLAITVGIVIYLVRQKKMGVKCVGCPYGGKCSGNCGGNCTENHNK